MAVPLREILVVAGEASGDQHAAEVVAALQARDPGLRFFGMGGERLGARGVELLHGAHEINVMGVVEVLPKLRRILRVLAELKQAAASRRPAAAILVDIPDFNLRLAGELKRLGVPVAYYVSPMVWAWRRGRVKQIAERVAEMLCILPFEEAFYRQHGVPARYVGSPVLEQVPAPAPAAHFRRALGLEPARPVLALLPGSRHSEVSRLLPDLARAAREVLAKHPEAQVVVPVAPALAEAELRRVLEAQGVRATLVAGRAPEVVGASEVAIVASGTATLEAALMERPLVVVYRVAPLSYVVGRLLVKVPHIALPNLLLQRRAVPELLQGALTPGRVAAEVERLWPGAADREPTLAALRELRAVLGPPGAAGRAAEAILNLIQSGARVHAMSPPR